MSKSHKKRLTKDDIKHVADLVKIHLSDAEIDKIRGQLETALDCADTFNKLDTKNVEITSSSVGTENIFREDKPSESLKQKDALSNAGAVKDGYITVQRFIRK